MRSPNRLGVTTYQTQGQAEYLNAETDEARSAAQKRLATLTGRTDAADWGVQVTPTTKNVDGSTTQGSVIRYNKRTGEVQRVDDGGTGDGPAKVSTPEQLKALPAGSIYIGPDGKQYRKG